MIRPSLAVRGTLDRRALDEGAGAWLERVEGWLRERYSQMLFGVLHGPDTDGLPALFLRFHPAADVVALSVASAGPRPWGQAAVSTRPSVQLRANTSGAGPGYHRFVCEIARQLGVFANIRWRFEPGVDSTGYFHSADEAALYRAFDLDLQAQATALLPRLDAAEPALGLLLPPGNRFLVHGAVATPLGPRDRAWLAAAALDGANGRDLYPWWEDGRGVTYAQGRAAALLWMEVRWRPPLTDAERATLVEISALLEGLLTRDPLPHVPWRAWQELLSLLDEEGPLAATVAGQAASTTLTPAIGYRRGLVRVILPGGWSVAVPGGLAEGLEPDGTWVAFDEHSTLWVSVMGPGEEDRGAAPLLEEAPGEDLLSVSHEGQGWVGRATLEDAREQELDEEGRTRIVTYRRLAGRCRAETSLLVITICFTEELDDDAALQIWRSVHWEQT